MNIGAKILEDEDSCRQLWQYRATCYISQCARAEQMLGSLTAWNVGM
jgi:hypothetical protein